MLLTKHQQAKSVWLHKPADVLLTKHQHAKFMWPQRTKLLKQTQDIAKLATTHYSNNKHNKYILYLNLSVASSFFGSRAAGEVSTQENIFFEALGMSYFIKTLMIEFLTYLVTLHAAIPFAIRG